MCMCVDDTYFLALKLPVTLDLRWASFEGKKFSSIMKSTEVLNPWLNVPKTMNVHVKV